MSNIHPNQSRYLQMTHNDLDRRNFMQKMVSLFGLTAATAVLSGCNQHSATKAKITTPDPISQHSSFSENQETILYTICNTILPKTDTPSATEVGCHDFVQHQLIHCYSAQQQQDCIGVINALEQQSQQAFNRALPLLSAAQQQQLLTDFERADLSSPTQKEHFAFLKALIVFGYFTSEVGATQVLNYQQVPGGFKGEISINADTKAWGSLTYY